MMAAKITRQIDTFATYQFSRFWRILALKYDGVRSKLKQTVYCRTTAERSLE